ncbi:MAG: ABC transporter permease [Acidobacteriota bacterium]|nr:ABC transporter permease [Acidobacteriota bacterium]
MVAANAVGLAVGIGLAAAVTHVFTAGFLSPPAGISNPERLLFIPLADNYPLYSTLRQVKSIDVAAYARRTLSVRADGAWRSVPAQCVTQTYFGVLGVAPSVGRTFHADMALDARAAIVSDHFWRRQLGARALSTLELTIGSSPYEVVGVAPAGFRGTAPEPADLWILLAASPELCSSLGRDLLETPSASWLTTLGRLRTGAAPGDAAAEIEPLLEQRRHRSQTDAAIPAVETLLDQRGQRRQRDRVVMVWLQIAALVLFVIAALNAAALMTIRMIERADEISIRYQLGASRPQIVALLSAEPLAFTVFAGLGGFGLARFVLASAVSYVPYSESGWNPATTATWAVLFALAATALLCVAPALTASLAIGKPDLGARARLGRKGAADQAVIISLLALTFAAAVGAGFLRMSLSQLKASLGFTVDRLAVITVDVHRTLLKTDSEAEELRASILDAINRHPGTESASLTSHAPLDTDVPREFIGVRGIPTGRPVLAAVNLISSNYFSTLAVPVLQGHVFPEAQGRSDVPRVVIDSEIAHALWPGEPGLGRCVFLMGRNECVRVVGITAPVRSHRIMRVTAELFLPAYDAFRYDLAYSGRAVVVRMRRGNDLRELSRVAASRSSTVPVQIRVLDGLVDRHAVAWHTRARTLTALSYVAIGLTALGLSSTFALMARRRRAEFGLRMALGASPWHVVRLIVRRGTITLGAGLCLGAVCAFAFCRLLQSAFPEAGAQQAWPYVAAALLLAGAAGCGLAWPVWIGIRVDPKLTMQG